MKERERVALVAERIDDALDRPLVMAGSGVLARTVIAYLDNKFALLLFAETALKTLRDGERHDRTLISEREPKTAIRFQSWSGTHLEMLHSRRGKYLADFCGVAAFLSKAVPLAGFLQIDAFLVGDITSLDTTGSLSIDVEFSFLPGWACGLPKEVPNPLPEVFMVNRSVCSDEEVQQISKVSAR
jgi:hypothetical protein